MKKLISLLLASSFCLSASAQVAPNSYLDGTGIHIVTGTAQNVYATVPAMCSLRLYTQTGHPNADSPGYAVSTLFVGPSLQGNQTTFQQTNGSYSIISSVETSVSMSSDSAGFTYDVYVKNIAGTETITQSAWTGSVPPTRGADSLGRLTKNGDTTSLLIGWYQTVGATTTQNDNYGGYLVSNVYNTVSPVVGPTGGAPLYISAQTTAPVSTVLSFTHGLGRPPYFMRLMAVCVANDTATDYVVGDQIEVSNGAVYDYTSGSYGCAIYSTSTTINVITSVNGFAFIRKTAVGGAIGSQTPVTSQSNFKLVLYAW
jgi:hypothetical protein